MHFVHPQVIDRPLAEVFAFVSDPENLPRWNYYVIGCTKLEAGPTRVGSTYRLVRKSDSRVFGVTEFERDRRLVIRFRAPTPPLEIRFTLESTGTGTRLTNEWELKGIAGFVAGFARGPIRRAVGENLDKLRELLETGRTQLQDGRNERYVSAP
jgi:uncharacterized protein YndB with AHSA1/START domain